MQITDLELNNFRNYRALTIRLDPNINIIYGENAQGKTNMLESIYMCSLGKSHRGNKENEIIKIGEEEAHIKGTFMKDNIPLRIDIHLKKNGNKGIAVNQLPIHKISELYGKANMVIFSPEDLDIVKRGPSVRRNFLNQELCQIDPIYVNNLINYTKILKQRHELLKKMQEQPSKMVELSETLEVWDMQLAKFGSKIIETRKTFIEELNEIILDIHYEITGGNEKIKIIYEPSVDENSMYEALLKNRERDKYTKNTSVGPHRDDFSFFDKETNLKIYGSQGQQRTCVVSLKLAEIQMIKNVSRVSPILLLDDVLSELDRNRQLQLLKCIGDTQTIITCTGMDELVEEKISNAKKFYIREAKIVDR